MIECSESNAMPEDPSRGLASDWHNMYFWVFMFARLIQTVAAATTPLNMTYIDENVSQRNSPVYTTTVILSIMISNSLGMVLAGLSLKIHADWYKTHVSKLTQNDPEW